MTERRKDGFTFKQFFVAHDKSPMKVTTDSCLLGAWAPVTHQPKRVLDIGCGCGIIGLMLAQRLNQFDIHIDAIDIDHNAVVQCQENIKHSPFNTIQTQCVDINQFRTNYQYDLIVTNPPYFEPATNCRDRLRQQARYTHHLNHTQLLVIVERLLHVNGYFCLVLPYHLSSHFKTLAIEQGFHLHQEMNVKYQENKSISLVLMGFSLNKTHSIVTDTLVMRESNKNYTQEFTRLLNDFYLFEMKNKTPHNQQN